MRRSPGVLPLLHIIPGDINEHFEWGKELLFAVGEGEAGLIALTACADILNRRIDDERGVGRSQRAASKRLRELTAQPFIPRAAEASYA